MIHPSYVDLMKVVNKNVEEGETPVINSRYSIVMATAKRARQIVDGDEPLVKVSRGEKPLSTAVAELNQGEIRILAEDEEEEDYTELLLQESEGAEETEGSDEEEADGFLSAESASAQDASAEEYAAEVQEEDAAPSLEEAAEDVSGSAEAESAGESLSDAASEPADLEDEELEIVEEEEYAADPAGDVAE